jgi:ABC-type multidrug transport system fused ATPase/permease subunit
LGKIVGAATKHNVPRRGIASTVTAVMLGMPPRESPEVLGTPAQPKRRRVLKIPNPRAAWSVVVRVESLTGPVRGRLVAVGVVAALAGFAEAILLLTIANVATGLTGETNLDEMGLGPLAITGMGVPTMLALGAVLVVSVFLLQLVAARGVARLYARSIHKSRTRFLEVHSKAVWPAKEEMQSGAVVQAATAYSSKVADAVLSAGMAVAAGANFLALLVSAILIDPVGAVAILVGVVVLIGVTVPIIRMARRFNSRLVVYNDDFASAVQEYSAVGREIRVFGVEQAYCDSMCEISEAQSRTLEKARLSSSLSSVVFKASALALILGLLSVAQGMGSSAVTSFAAISLILLRSVSYGQGVQTQLQTVAETGPWVSRIVQLVERLDAQGERANSGVRLPYSTGRSIRVELDDLSFGYSDTVVVLRDLTLGLPQGSLVGIVGPSGAGKTTLAELVLGLREPSVGAVLVNGVDLREIDPDDWRRRTAFVPQEPVLITGSIRENVRFHRDWVSDEQIEIALKSAYVDVDSSGWSHGIDTEVGSLGSMLSGGQKQRIAIARALCGRPGLMVFDEPTSALDSRSEDRVTDALKAARGSATVLVIAHRLSTLRDCDYVVVLKEGRLQASGPPSELGDLSLYLTDAP